MKRRMLCLILATVMLLTGIPLPVMASGSGETFAFELKADGKNRIEVHRGDIITVALTLKRTDAEQPYTLYAMQDEIRYDSKVFELVGFDVNQDVGIVGKDMGASKGGRELYMNYLSMSGGTTQDANLSVGWFQLRVTGDSGTYVISNEDYLVSLRDGSGSYPCSAEDLTVVITDGCRVNFVTDTQMQLPGQDVAYGGFLTKPENPVKDKYTFCGWYRDPERKDEWNFAADTVTENLTLYAKWLENEMDQDGRDTDISVEILEEETCVYTGKALTPEVVVWDNDQMLTEGIDYTVTYRNNTNACTADDPSVMESKRPQIIIQGKGNYKSSKKIIKYFTIAQADMKQLQVSLPTGVVTKSRDAKQTVKATVSMGTTKVAASAYTILYFLDEALSKPVDGITASGRYYVVLEAKKSGTDYIGNYCGKTDAVVIDAAPAAQMMEKASVTAPRTITVQTKQPDRDEAIQSLISKLVINKVTYLTTPEGIEEFCRIFEVTAVDADGTRLEEAELGRLLLSAGKKTLMIRARDNNEAGYVGAKSITVQIKGTALSKKQFTVTFDSTGNSSVTKVEYTGTVRTPAVFTQLQEGRDYTVSFKSGKTEVDASRIWKVGSYTLVITGTGTYSGTLSYSFSITQADLAKAYAAGRIRLEMDQTAEYDPNGAKPDLAVYFLGGDGMEYRLAEGVDYTVSCSGNKTVTDKASVTLKGCGTFRGSLNKSAAPALVYSVLKKDLAAEDISVVVTGITLKNDSVKSLKFSVNDGIKKISAKEYSSTISYAGDMVVLTVAGAEKLYTGSRTVQIRKNLISVTNREIQLSLKGNGKYYYTGEPIRPGVQITDSQGKDLSDCVTITYGTNTAIGSGTVTVTGNPEKGYCGSKTFKFTILPKWMEWKLW